MLDRLLFLPVALLLGVLLAPLHLNIFAFSAVIGVAVLAFDRIYGKHYSEYSLALAIGFIFLGLALLAGAWWVANDHSLTLEALSQDGSFPKIVRRLPVFGAALATIGIVLAGTLAFRTWRADRRDRE